MKKWALMATLAFTSLSAWADIAVLEFVNKGDSQYNYLTKDLARNLSHELQKQVKEPVVNFEHVSRVVKEKNINAAQLDVLNVAVLVGKFLNVDKVVTGTIERHQSGFVMQTRMIDVNFAQEVKNSQDFNKVRQVSDLYRQLNTVASNLARLETTGEPVKGPVVEGPIHTIPDHPTPTVNKRHSVHIRFATDDITAFTIDGEHVYPDEHGVVQMLVNSGAHKLQAWRGFSQRELVYEAKIKLSGRMHYTATWQNGRLIKGTGNHQPPEPTIPPIEPGMISTKTFNQLMAMLDEEPNHQSKYRLMTELFKRRPISSGHAQQLVQLFEADNLRLETAKFLYHGTQDKDNYSDLITLMRSSESRRSLLRYITQNS